LCTKQVKAKSVPDLAPLFGTRTIDVLHLRPILVQTTFTMVRGRSVITPERALPQLAASAAIDTIHHLVITQ